MIYKFANDLPDDLLISGNIAIDTETIGLNIQRDRLCLVQLTNGDGNVYLVQFSQNNYNAPNLKKLLLQPDTVKIFHYARFDLASIKYWLGVDVRNIFCTKIASKIARTYTDYHGLKDLCRELLGVQISKQQQSSYWGAEVLSKEQEEYAANDVIYLHRLRQVLIQMLESEKRLTLAQQVFEFVPTRVALDLQGWLAMDIFAH
jgi:ribonuclease D